MALYDSDRDFIEHWCQRIAQNSRDLALVATAALCLGHTARRFRTLSDESIALVFELARRTDLDGRVLDALDDVQHYLPLDVSEDEQA